MLSRMSSENINVKNSPGSFAVMSGITPDVSVKFGSCADVSPSWLAGAEGVTAAE